MLDADIHFVVGGFVQFRYTLTFIRSLVALYVFVRC